MIYYIQMNRGITVSARIRNLIHHVVEGMPHLPETANVYVEMDLKEILNFGESDAGKIYVINIPVRLLKSVQSERTNHGVSVWQETTTYIGWT